ncbi:hypothetical protein ILYODFUR_032691 [Ilyodon furcidens]|uniref:Uncharacterized protein n=1 Tax=Ilyodon furcidens TaxID=33524 RepID=A0ABV0TZR6_9TELE
MVMEQSFGLTRNVEHVTSRQQHVHIRSPFRSDLHQPGVITSPKLELSETQRVVKLLGSNQWKSEDNGTVSIHHEVLAAASDLLRTSNSPPLSSPESSFRG